MKLALAIPVAVGLAACDKPRGGSPVDAYASFARAAQRGDAKAAYALLSLRAQQQLARGAKDVSSASGGAINDDPAALAFSAAPRPEPVTEVKLISESGDQAMLAVKAGGRTAQVKMVKEQSVWKVDFGE